MVFAGSSLPASIAAAMRSSPTSAKSLRKMLVKPRFGKRRCSGIWPPSNPLMVTPVRDFCPFTPRPPVLPSPEPMPRPTRLRTLKAPGIVGNIVQFHGVQSPVPNSFLSLVDDAHEMLDLGDHAARRRSVLQRGAPMQLVEPQPDEGLALIEAPPDGAADLLDNDGLVRHGAPPQASAVAAAASPIAAPRLQAGDLDAAPRRHRAGAVLALQRIEGGAHHVVGIRGPHRLRHDVLDTERLEDGAHRAARDDARAGLRGAQDHLAGAVAPGNVVMQRAPFAQRHADQARAWPNWSPCGSPPAPRAPCRGRSPRGRADRPRRRAPRSRTVVRPSPPWQRG